MPADVPRYLREPPDLHPAIVGCVAGRGRVGTAEVLASVLALVADGALEARPSARRVTTMAGAEEVPVTELRVAAGRWESFDPLDRELISLLTDTLGGPAALTLTDLQVAVRHRPAPFDSGLRTWGAHVRQRAQEAGLLEGRRRTPAGAEAHARHQAFRRYLRDFGTLEDEPPVAVELWGRYLAFAVLFDLGERVATELDLEGVGIAAHPDLAVWKAWFGISGR